MNNQLRSKLLVMAGGGASILEYKETQWASATFEGTKHRMLFKFTDVSAADAFVDDLDIEPDIELSGQSLIDIDVVEVCNATVTVEALTLNVT